MAQVGSFVSAERAQVLLLDRIFTRIGAGDNVAEGKSTFLVEAARITELEQELVSKSAVTQKLKTIDYNNLSPKQAFDLLWELKS